MHLIDTLQQQNVISIDWSGSNYLGFILDWNYKDKHVTLSMPHYLKKALLRFKHLREKKPTYSPAPYDSPEYGAKIQYAPVEETTKQLSDAEIKILQTVVGIFLYYVRALDNTMLVSTNNLASA